jgi:transposase
MAASYSVDLRRKILQACERHSQSQRAVAELFGVSRSFVEGLLRRYRRSGELVPVRHRPGRHPKLDAAACQQLQQWLQEQSDLTLAELAQRLQAEQGLVVSQSALCRMLQQLGWRRKKDSPCHRTRHASGRSGSSAVSTSDYLLRREAAEIH